MSGMRLPLILLILLVSVISWFLLSPVDTVVAPGVTSEEESAGEKSDLSQKNPDDSNTLSDPPVVVAPADGDDPPLPIVEDPPMEILVRVMDSLGTVLGPGNWTGLLGGNEEELRSSEAVEFIDAKQLIAGGREYPKQLLTPQSGRWIIDTTEQNLDSGLIGVDRMTLVRPEDQDQRSVLIIAAKCELAEGSRLRVQVIGDGRVLDGGILKVGGLENTWVLPLVARQWYAGLLQVQVTWSWEAATDIRRQQMIVLRGEQFAGQDWLWEGVLSVDTAAESTRQGELIRRWYKAALDEVEMTRDLLLVAGAHARGKRARLVRDDERMGRLLTHPLAPVLDELGRGDEFDEKRWRKLIDEELPQSWRRWVEAGAIPWPDRYPGPARNVPLLFHTLLKYSRLESTVIYMALGKERHQNDFVADFDWDPMTERSQTLKKLRNFIDAIREKLAHLDR